MADNELSARSGHDHGGVRKAWRYLWSPESVHYRRSDIHGRINVVRLGAVDANADRHTSTSGDWRRRNHRSCDGTDCRCDARRQTRKVSRLHRGGFCCHSCPRTVGRGILHRQLHVAMGILCQHSERNYLPHHAPLRSKIHEQGCPSHRCARSTALGRRCLVVAFGNRRNWRPSGICECTNAGSRNSLSGLCRTLRHSRTQILGADPCIARHRRTSTSTCALGQLDCGSRIRLGDCLSAAVF